MLAALVAGGAAHAQTAGPLERLASLADYVAADYAGAVHDGKVIAASEYDEQRGLLAEAHKLAHGHSDGRPRGWLLRSTPNAKKLIADVDRKASVEAQVVADCRAVHKRLIDDYGLVLAPWRAVGRARQAALHAGVCAVPRCRRFVRTPTRRAEFKPPPLSFFDGERMPRFSPALDVTR